LRHQYFHGGNQRKFGNAVIERRTQKSSKSRRGAGGRQDCGGMFRKNFGTRKKLSHGQEHRTKITWGLKWERGTGTIKDKEPKEKGKKDPETKH